MAGTRRVKVTMPERERQAALEREARRAADGGAAERGAPKGRQKGAAGPGTGAEPEAKGPPAATRDND